MYKINFHFVYFVIQLHDDISVQNEYTVCAYRAWTIYDCAWPTRRPRQILTFLYIQKDKIENITISGYIESKDILKILYATFTGGTLYT